MEIFAKIQAVPFSGPPGEKQAVFPLFAAATDI